MLLAVSHSVDDEKYIVHVTVYNDTHYQLYWCTVHNCIFKPPPPVGAGGGYMFSGRPSVPLSVRPSVRDSRGSFMFPRYLQYLLTDFCQTFVTGASWYTDDLITFLEVHSTRR